MSEHEDQVALIRWADASAVELPALRWLFAVPNGGLRDKIVAARMKAEGLRAGVPDLFLPLPRLTPGHERYGLFVEMKYGRNKPSDVQVEWHDYLREAGYEVVVCWGWQEAARVILDYMDVAEDDAHRLLGEPWRVYASGTH